MTEETDLQQRIGYAKGRINACQELNDYLSSHTGFLGFIRWWGLNGLVRKWIDENNALIKRIRE